MNLECLNPEPCQGTSIEIEHVFACEISEKKRSVILKEHNVRHLFGDVHNFRDGRGYCYKTGRHVDINADTCAIDILISGPVCTNLSNLNNQKREYAGCYDAAEDETSGASGPTYIFGFRKAGVAILFPILFIYIYQVYMYIHGHGFAYTTTHMYFNNNTKYIYIHLNINIYTYIHFL